MADQLKIDEAAIEKIARAIFQSFQDTQDNHLRKETWDGSPGLRPYYLAAARAALEVVRELDD